MKKIILFIIITFLLTGCYNYNELNKLSIVSSIAIDKDGDNYKVSAQVMNAKNEEDTTSSKIIVYEETGKSINEALRKMNNKTSRKIYGGHLSKLVVSEEIAKEGIINVIDNFQRLTEIKDEFTITVTRGINAGDVIKIITLPDTIPADFVKNSIKESDIETALTYSSKLDEFVSFYLKKGIDPVITVIEVHNYNKEGTTTNISNSSYPETYIELNNIAITNEGKLEKFLNQEETIGYNIVRNRITNMIIPIKCGENYASILINTSKTKRKVKKENNKYVININVKSKGTITEYNCINDLTKEKETKRLEKETKKILKNYINKVLEVSNNTKSKFLGLERDIYLKYPKESNKNYTVKVNIDFKIIKKGELRNSIKGAKK